MTLYEALRALDGHGMSITSWSELDEAISQIDVSACEQIPYVALEDS